MLAFKQAGVPTGQEKVVVVDPVCQMALDASTAAAMAVFEGEQFYFCSLGCHRRFLSDPSAHSPSATAPQLGQGGQPCSMAAGPHALAVKPEALARSAGFGFLAAVALLGF